MYKGAAKRQQRISHLLVAVLLAQNLVLMLGIEHVAALESFRGPRSLFELRLRQLLLIPFNPSNDRLRGAFHLGVVVQQKKVTSDDFVRR